MSAYSPPLENLPTFDTSQFTNANNRFLQYPVAQGTETLQDTIVNGNLTTKDVFVNGVLNTKNIISSTTLDIASVSEMTLLSNALMSLSTTADLDITSDGDMTLLTDNTLNLNGFTAVINKINSIDKLTINSTGIQTNNITSYYGSPLAISNFGAGAGALTINGNGSKVRILRNTSTIIADFDLSGCNLQTGVFTGDLVGNVNGNVTGNLNGNATNSLTTNTALNNSNVNYQLVMGITPSGSIGVPTPTTLYTDGAFQMSYNPSTSTLIVPNITATITGTSTNSTTTNTTLDNSNINYQLVMGITPSGSIGVPTPTTLYTDGGNYIYYNPSTSTLTVPNINGNASSATNSTNIAGGSAGRIPYQTSSSSTSFTATGVTNQVLTSNSGTAPTWNNDFGLITGTLVYTGNQTFTTATNGSKLNMFYGGNAIVTMPSSATDLTYMKFSIKSFGGVATTLTINTSGGTLIISITTPATTAGSAGTTLMYSTNTNISAWVVVQ